MKMNLEQIPRIGKISKAEFQANYVQPQRPVVIEKLIEDWPAYKKWDLDYINEMAGDKTVPLYDDRPISSKYKFNEHFIFKGLLLQDFQDTILLMIYTVL